MKKKFIHILLAGSLIILFSCKSKKEEGKGTGEVSPGTKVERHRSGPTRPATLNQVLQKRPTRSQISLEESNALSRQIASLSSKDLQELLEQTSKTRNTPSSRVLFELAISEFAKRSPETVMSWFVPENMAPSEAGFVEAGRELAKSRPEILQAWLSNEMNKADRRVQGDCLHVGLSVLSQVDAKSAFEFAVSRTWEVMPMHEIVNDVFGYFGEQNPVEADRAAMAALKGRDLDLARNNIALGAAQSDPDLALSIAAKRGDPAGQGRTTSSILSELMDSDPSKAISKLRALDPTLLQATLQASPEGVDSVVSKLGKADPELLTNLLAKMVASESNAEVFRAAVASLGAKSPEKSMEIIQSLPDSQMKTKLFGEHYTSLARENPENALQAASTLADPKLRAEAYRSIGDFVGPKGWSETSRMLDSLPEADKATFLNSAAPSLANGDPKNFANLMSSGIVTLQGARKNEVLSLLGSRLNSSDPAFTKGWLDALPAEDQPFAMKGIASDMAKTNVDGLATMLQSMKQDKKWEQGVKVLIDNVQKADPEMADQWKGALKGAGYN